MPEEVDLNQARLRWAGLALLVLMIGARLALAAPPLLLIALALVLGGLILQRMGIGLGALLGRGAPAAEWRTMLVHVPAVMLASFGLAYLSLLALYAISPETVQAQLELMRREYQGPRFILLAVVIAPVFEELLFRGMLFPLLALRWGATAAMLVSAAVFGAFHLNVLGATVFGLFATVLYMRTGSLLVPIAAHFINNALVVLLTLAVPAAGIPDEVPQLTLQDLRQGLVPALLMAALGGFFVLRLLRRHWPPVLPAPFRAIDR